MAGQGPALDRYGFVQDTKDEPRPAADARKEVLRSVKWQRMIHEWGTFVRGAGQNKLKARVRKGIPDGVRGHIWQLASGSMQTRAVSRGLYAQLRATPSVEDAQIEKDLHRTMPSHVLFQGDADGQRQLFNVCHALAVRDPQMGYNQAEAYVAAVLLTYMTEEESFFTLAHMARQRGQGRLWASNMEGFSEMSTTLDHLIRTHIKDLWWHLHHVDEHLGITPDLYALGWLTTLFAKDFPFESTLRIWDIFLCEPKMYPKCTKILYQVVIAILKHGKREIMHIRQVPDIIACIRELPWRGDLRGDALINKALDVKLKTADIATAFVYEPPTNATGHAHGGSVSGSIRTGGGAPSSQASSETLSSPSAAGGMPRRR